MRQWMDMRNFAERPSLKENNKSAHPLDKQRAHLAHCSALTPVDGSLAVQTIFTFGNLIPYEDQMKIQ